MRLSGHLRLRAEAREDGRSFLAAQSFRAPYHLGKAYWEPDTRVLMAQVVNPTAGMLEGDELASEIVVRRDAALLVTTPSASRAFAMKAGQADCVQTFAVDPGAWLEVLPEPLVPHRDTRFRQVTRIEVAPGGGLFFADLLMPGRVAHGEAWQWKRLVLELEARIGGELVLKERFDHRAESLRTIAAAAGMGEGACFGNAIVVGPKNGDAPPWRTGVNALHGPEVWVGATCLGRGAWSIKFIAAGGVRLRETLKEIRRILSAQFPRLCCESRKL